MDAGASAAVRPRIVGSENEYAFLIKGKSSEDLASDILLFILRVFFYRNFENIWLPKSALLRHFIPNQGQIYVDTGCHPEYATPECAGANLLLSHEKAGEFLFYQMESVLNELFKNPDLLEDLISGLSRVYSYGYENWDIVRSFFGYNTIRKNYSPEYRNVKVAVYKNNIALPLVPQSENKFWQPDSVESYGYHENYLVARSPNFSNMSGFVDAAGDYLVPHLLSRSVFAGSGLVMCLNGRLAYGLSQRAEVMKRLVSGQTTCDRPLINTRDEPLCDGKRWLRLHLICGDSSLSQFAIWLKIKTTSAILDVIEDSGFTAEEPSILGRINDLAIGYLQFLNRNNTLLKNSIPARGPFSLTMVDIQKYYRDLVYKYYFEKERKEPDSEIGALIDRWTFILDLASADNPAEKLAPYVDWAAKLSLINRTLDKHGANWEDGPDKKVKYGEDSQFALYYLLKQIDLSYHRIHPDFSLYQILKRKGLMKDDIVSNEDIKNALTISPPGRPTWRAKLMEAVKDILFKSSADKGSFKCSLDWDEARITLSYNHFISATNSDPYNEDIPWQVTYGSQPGFLY